MDAFLDARRDLVNFNLTKKHFEFFFTRMIPEVAIHSKSQDERIVREHYDRGDDFFEAFLGDRMVYTSAIFNDEHESLEQAQDNKMNLVCRKLMLRPGDEMLDIGCGWGTLAMHAAKNFGARSTGITISKNQTAFGNDRIAKAGLSDRARIECLDYRDIPRRQYDRISSLEMVEHVGVKNLSKYCKLVYDLLKDDGIFLLQWVGLRRGGDLGVPVIGLRPEDLIWGLFMSKYIFPGADASIPLSDMSKALEKAGFQIQSVENISIHYSETIRLWHLNWQKHSAAVLQAYGERWYRLWHLFLGWSWRIAAQGTRQGFQVVAHKNLDSFDRKMFIRHGGQGQPGAPGARSRAGHRGERQRRGSRRVEPGAVLSSRPRSPIREFAPRPRRPPRGRSRRRDRSRLRAARPGRRGRRDCPGRWPRCARGWRGRRA